MIEEACCITNVKPALITDPEENKRRAAMWEGIPRKHVKHRELSWVELLDYAEERCDFTPKYDVDDGITHSDNFYCEDCETHFEGLETYMYSGTINPNISKEFTSLENQRIKPSGDVKDLFEAIKYGDGLNVYWRVNFWCSLRKKEVLRKCGRRVGKLTKEQCPNKGNHGNYISTEELLERAKGKGQTARNARMLLKRRGVTW